MPNICVRVFFLSINQGHHSGTTGSHQIYSNVLASPERLLSFLKKLRNPSQTETHKSFPPITYKRRPTSLIRSVSPGPQLRSSPLVIQL
mmetsp:Transcript_57161/g.66823  ORF Transcript_57161/g.66823 Transcript_57161/m.66823 type:complete len:89 (-) Transcript_57161:539-805(-)